MENVTAQQNAVALAVLQTEVAYLKDSVAEMVEDIKAMRRQMDEARGGWRTLLLVGGAAGSVGSVGSWLIAHWRA